MTASSIYLVQVQGPDPDPQDCFTPWFLLLVGGYIYTRIFSYRMNMRTALAKWSNRPLFETPVFFLATLFHLDPDLYVSTQIKIIIKWSFMIIIDE